MARDAHRIRVREYAGAEPAIILMHGFPDNMHLYDRLVPHLAGRRVILFDFLGWGESDKPDPYDYTFANLELDLDAVLADSQVDRAILVAHDASGPPAINWALKHPERVASLVLLNTFYGPTEALSLATAPEAIRIFADPTFSRLAKALIDAPPEVREWLYDWQVGQFFDDAEARAEFVPLFYAQFKETPSAYPAFVDLNADLVGAVATNAANATEMRLFDPPVRIAFGANDPYLNPDVARDLAELFGDAELHLIPNASHYVQLDQPARVAEEILTAPTAE